MAPRQPDSKPDRNTTVAIALKYDRATDTAPRLVAKGEGPIAEQILALAREHGVTVRKDADLANLLAAAELDCPIPVEAYVAVAEILSYIYGRRETSGGRS